MFLFKDSLIIDLAICLVYITYSRQIYDESAPIGKVLEIESLQKYVLKIENLNRDHKLKLMVEDTVNRFNFEFVRPTKNGKKLFYMLERSEGTAVKDGSSAIRIAKRIFYYKNKSI